MRPSSGMGRAVTSPVRHTLPCYIKRDGQNTSDGVLGFFVHGSNRHHHSLHHARPSIIYHTIFTLMALHGHVTVCQLYSHGNYTGRYVSPGGADKDMPSPVKFVRRALVPIRVLEQIFLVVVLCIIPGPRCFCGRDNLLPFGSKMFLLHLLHHTTSNLLLLWRVKEDSGTVLCTP